MTLPDPKTYLEEWHSRESRTPSLDVVVNTGTCGITANYNDLPLESCIDWSGVPVERKEQNVVLPLPYQDQGPWQFKFATMVAQGEVHGLIYREGGKSAVGEWTARLYRAGEVSLRTLVETPGKDVKDMRGQYQVTAVDPDTEEFVLDVKVVAGTHESAKFKALKGSDIEDLEQYDFAVVRLGDVRAKKQVQEVKIVGS